MNTTSNPQNTATLIPASREGTPREEKLAAARAVLDAGLAHVGADPEALARFLAFRARFHDYSLCNAVLIWRQCPSARYCMGYRAWQTHGRQVRKGEKGLTILAPVTRKEQEAEGPGLAGDDEHREGRGRTVVGYRTATVFDYAQTDAVAGGALVYTSPSPRLGADDPDGLAEALRAVARALGYAVRYDETGYADGRCSFAKREITVAPSLSPADRAAVLCHEVCHALAHDPAGRVPADRLEGDRGLTTAQREIQAEGAAFMALAALGLDTSRASLPYLKGWSQSTGTDGGAGDEALRRELAAIDRIARGLLGRLESLPRCGGTAAPEAETSSAEA